MKSTTTNDETLQQTATLTVDQAIQQAVGHHQAGRLQEAEQLYRAILQVQPNHSKANHNLGLLAVQTQQPAAGLLHFMTALEADPTHAQYWLSYIDALIQADMADSARQVLALGRQQGLQGNEVDVLTARLEADAQAAGQANAEYQPAAKESLPTSKNSKKKPKTKPAKSTGKSPGPQEISVLVALFNEGRYLEAATLARTMTERFPRHGFGWKALGAALKQMGRTEEALEPMRKAAILSPDDADTHSNLGNSLQELGRLVEAEVSCRRALRIKPDYAEAHNNLGITLYAQGRLNEAEASYRRALQLKPNYAEVHDNLGNTLRNTGRLDEAEASSRQALQLKPDYAEAHNNLGNTLLELDRLNEAEASYRQAAQIKPDFAEAHNNLGGILQKSKRLDEAEASYRQALRIKPDYAEAHNNLGSVFHDLERLDEAEASYRQALRLRPNFASAHNNLGLTLQELGNLVGAEANYKQALQIKPDFAEAHNNLGGTLKGLGRLNEAEASCRQALQIKPDYAEAHNNLGAALNDLGRLVEAEANFLRALQIKPDFAEALNNQSNTFKDLGRLTEAEACCRRALEIKPDYAEAHHNMGNILKDLSRLDEAETGYRRALEIKPDSEDTFSNLLFVLNYHPDKSGEEIFEVYREYDAKFGLPHRSEWRPHDNSRETQRRLKVGYVSPDFYKHSVRHFLEPLLAHHDKNALEIYAYAELTTEDQFTARYKSYVDHWVSTIGIDDAALAERIRADGIDILVDLAGHTAHNRLEVFARKPAPVSLTWLGYGYSTGLTAIDYILTDEASAPAGSEELFSETPWRLATPGYVYRPAGNMGEPNLLPAMSAGHVTFGTLSRGVRINHRVIRVWSKILKRVQGAKLVIDSTSFCETYTQDIVAEKFAAHGISRDQLQIGCHSPPWEVLRGLDIGLDCFPHNSGTTLFESLYMGVPYITLAGRPSVGRIGSSILEGVGHPEWIAETEDGYVEKAVALAGDLPRLAALRAGLRQEMQAGPLMDEPAFAHKVEAAYRDMFEQWARAGTIQGTDTSMAAETYGNLGITFHEPGQNEPESQERDVMTALFNEGRITELEALFRTWTVRFPTYVPGWQALAALFKQQGQSAAVLAPLYKTLAELLPEDAEAHFHLGNTLLELGQLDDAVASYHQALKFKQDYAEAHSNLGNALSELGQLDEAIATYQQALKIKFDFAEAHSNLGAILLRQGQLIEAEFCQRRALEIDPNYAEAHYNLGNTLHEQDRLSEAEMSFQRALVIKPDFADAQINLGLALIGMGRLVEAEASHRRALEIAPEYASAHQNLAIILAYLSDFEHVVSESDTALHLTSTDTDSAAWEQRLYAFSYHPDLTAAEIYGEFVRWGDRFPDPVTDFSAHDRTPGRRLRIGYVSPDFRHHTSRFFFWPLFANHDSAVVELYAYANVRVEDEFTQAFKGLFGHWRNIRGVADGNVADMIRRDGIDILVDCCNHMRDDRLGVFALKPAPIQATWLGAAWTTGLKTVDYALIDPYMAPEGTLTRETIVRLPHCFVAYRATNAFRPIWPNAVAPCREGTLSPAGVSVGTPIHNAFKVVVPPLYGNVSKHRST